MMVRPRKFRNIWFNPEVTYYKPAGIPVRMLEEVVLTKEEVESLRLSDYEGLDQGSSAKKMKISQPTFNRTLASARKKISEAIIDGKAIRIEGE